jgi:hydroxymethylbilane synthase
MSRVRLGTRASALALRQAEQVRARLRDVDGGLDVELREIRTQGDERQDLPLDALEGVGFFTSVIERALSEGEIDFAVHSFKDLPVELSPDLCIAAVPERAPVEDALCARDGLRLDALPTGARVGTSSLRRAAQLRSLRPDLAIQPLRGNVPTRLDRVTSGDLDAVVLARAGLERLGLAARMTQVFRVEEMVPAPAQGALAIQARVSDADLVRRLRALDHAPSRLAAEAERRLLFALGGGCSVPVGACARWNSGRVHLVAGVFDPATGARLLASGEADAPDEVAGLVARELLAGGAAELLARSARVPRLSGEDA